MMNEANRRNLKALMDLLSDNHKEITHQAAYANKLILKADELQANKLNADTSMKWAGRHLDNLAELLEEQATRIYSVRDEILRIKKNLKTI